MLVFLYSGGYMKLTEYLAEKKLTQEQFARLVQKTQGFVSHYLMGRCELSAKTTLAWSAVTNYLVTPHELSPHLYPNPDDGLPKHLRA